MPYFFLCDNCRSYISRLIGFRRENCGDAQRLHLGRIPPEISNSKSYFFCLPYVKILLNLHSATVRPLDYIRLNASNTVVLNLSSVRASDDQKCCVQKFGFIKMAPLRFWTLHPEIFKKEFPFLGLQRFSVHVKFLTILRKDL